MPTPETISEERAHARRRLAGGYLGCGALAPTPDLKLAGEDITVTTDRLGRETILVPDAVARYMQARIVDGWVECRGLATGESRVFGSSTYMYWLTATIVEAYAASDLPDGLDAADRWPHERDREYAARYGSNCYAPVVGVSDWDAEARWWRDYDANRDLHLSGHPSPDKRLGCPAYRWAG